jgi:hypothetical protein
MRPEHKKCHLVKLPKLIWLITLSVILLNSTHFKHSVHFFLLFVIRGNLKAFLMSSTKFTLKHNSNNFLKSRLKSFKIETRGFCLPNVILHKLSAFKVAWRQHYFLNKCWFACFQLYIEYKRFNEVFNCFVNANNAPRIYFISVDWFQ